MFHSPLILKYLYWYLAVEICILICNMYLNMKDHQWKGGKGHRAQQTKVKWNEMYYRSNYDQHVINVEAL